jgi:nitrate/nitrite transporter NarK
MNSSIHPLASKISSWKYDWEKPYVERMEEMVFRNTFKDIRRILLELGGHGTRFAFECCDLGHLTAFFAGGVLPFYRAIDMKRPQGIQAAARLAFINTIGLIGGFVGPYLFGMTETVTGRSDSGFMMILAASVFGLALIAPLDRAIRREGNLHEAVAINRA